MLGLANFCYSLHVCKFDDSSFSRYRDMVGAHQNLNVSRDLTTPFSEIVCHPWLALAMVNLSYNFEVENGVVRDS